MTDIHSPEPHTEADHPEMGSRRTATWVIFAALTAILPIPFVVPFWAAALVPSLYLMLSVGNVGKVGGCYGLVFALILYGVASLLSRVIYKIHRPSIRIRLVGLLVVGLFAVSFLPIYAPGLDPIKPNVIILALYKHGIPVGL